MGGDKGRSGSDPITWLSDAADVPRDDLDQVRHVRNAVAGSRQVPDRAVSSALATLDRALAVLRRTRLPD